MAIYRLENISFADVDKLDRENTIVIFPCGSMEQHGPHLPNGMDTQVAVKVIEAAMKNVEKDVDCLYIPPIPIGQSPEHMDFPGTITFTAENIHPYAKRDLLQCCPTWIQENVYCKRAWWKHLCNWCSCL